MLKNNDISIPEACYADLCKVGFFERKQVKLTIIWNEKISRNKQILTLKKLYPELNKVSTVEIYKITKKRRNGNLQRWDGDLLLNQSKNEPAQILLFQTAPSSLLRYLHHE